MHFALIDVWGFDEEAVEALRSMEMDDADKQLIEQFAILLPKDSPLVKQLYATTLSGDVRRRYFRQPQRDLQCQSENYVMCVYV